MMLSSVTFNDGIVLVIGDATRDVVTLVDNGSFTGFELTVNGDSQSFLYNSVTRVQVLSGGGNDVIDNQSFEISQFNGGAGNDVIRGGFTNDYIVGGDGNDVLVGRAGNDRLFGGDGADRIYGVTGLNRIEGGSGNDTIFGGTLRDVVWGQDGDDIINGGNGDDALLGGNGNDTINGGNGNDRIGGSFGEDRITGGHGNDTIFGQSDDDIIDGGTGNDTISGGVGDDQINGRSGNDELYGQGGDDLLVGGSGDDLLVGGSGDDVLRGNAGADDLRGEGGNDNLFGGIDTAIDALSGGGGLDRFFVFGASDDIEFTVNDGTVLVSPIPVIAETPSDFQAASDALVQLYDGDQSWTDAEVETVSGSLDLLFARTNSNVLLNQPPGTSHGSLRLVNDSIFSPGVNFQFTDDSRLIALSDEAFSGTVASPEQILIHEIAHNWQEFNLGSLAPPPGAAGPTAPGLAIWDDFLAASGWTFIDGQWFYLSDSEFATIRPDRGNDSPFEDWGTMWEEYFFVSTTGTGELGGKLAIIDSFFDGLKQGRQALPA